jgi:hypothetical protein
MNSRDSAYDLAIAASLAEIAAKEAQEEEDDAERKGIKRRRVEEEEVGEHEEANVKRAKKKKDEEAGMECESKRKISAPHVHADPQRNPPFQSMTAPVHQKPSIRINTPTDRKAQANLTILHHYLSPRSTTHP